jgi:mycofactocin precursor peptide peptidase
MPTASRPASANTTAPNTAAPNTAGANTAPANTAPANTAPATAAPNTAVTLAAARWPDVEAGPRRLLIVPLGSLEQHGPHLPLDTDTRIAVAVAARACAGRVGVGVAPPIAIGASGEHADFPGTLSIGTEALRLVLVELGRHASLHWPAMLFVNGHGGNALAISDALKVLRDEGRRCHAWHAGVRSAPPADAGVDVAGQGTGTAAGPETRAAAGPDTEAPAAPDTEAPAGETAAAARDSRPPFVVDAHAGCVETSIMLALAPHDVRLDLAVPGETRPLTAIMPELRAHGTRHVSPNGVLGDPTGASAAEGERLLAQLTAALDETLGALLATSGD